MSNTCSSCGTSFSGSVSWSSGGSEYSCHSCSAKAKRSFEAAGGGGGNGCAVVALILLAAPVLAALAGLTMLT